MNKTAIKNFAIWARNKLISDISYKAGLLGITEKGIKSPLPQSTQTVQFFDIGTKEPSSVTGVEIQQRKRLVEEIERKAKQSDYATAYKNVIEEVAYTWFNRLIAIRFMEVNDYLPTRIRVLSSENDGKAEPDLVTHALEANLDYSAYEKDRIIQLKLDNKLDELFRMLFIKQCNALNINLPELFEKTNDYTELLLNVSFTDKEGVVYHLVNDIDEDDFNVSKEGQVEIIGWLYQYYNEERKNNVININKGSIKKDDIPAATQLFTTDWVVRYMVDNSLGRYWIERNPSSRLAEKLQYLIKPQNAEMQTIDEKITPQELTIFDPCMGSGHILVYAFDVLMEIYKENGYADRDAAQMIVQHNIFGLDIDKRAYQLAYFAVMMKARSYDRRFLSRDIEVNISAIEETNELSVHENDLVELDHRFKNIGNYLIESYKNAKEIGSLIMVNENSYDEFGEYLKNTSFDGQISIESNYWFSVIRPSLLKLVKQATIMTEKYSVVCTNPPYMNKYEGQLKTYILDKYKLYSGDLFSVFMYRNFDYCKKNGYSGFMTPYVWMFIKSYEQLREFIIANKSITTLVQMEYSAYEEATVPICSFVLKNGTSPQYGVYLKLSEFKGGMEIQKQKVLEALGIDNCDYCYKTDSNNFSKIPSSPIAFWASDSVVRAFESTAKIEDISETRIGMATANNDIFMRLWFEISYNKIGFNCNSREEAQNSKLKWFPYCKGGSFRKWYGNLEYVVNWENDGFAIQNFRDEKTGRVRSHNYNLEYIFKPGLTFTAISSSKFACRMMENSLFGSGGSGICKIAEINKFPLLAFVNSKIAEYLLGCLSLTMNFEVNTVGSLPFIINNNGKEISLLVSRIIEISKSDWDSYETSWDFQKHPLMVGNRIKTAYSNWTSIVDGRFSQLKENEIELNRIFINIYGLQGELSSEVDDKNITINRSNLTQDIKSLISYAVGCMLGRYSLDAGGLAYAGGQWDNLKYITYLPDKDNILPITDEEYFQDDITNRFVDFLKVVYGHETIEENLDFIADALGGNGTNSREIIRRYFIKDFYKEHCKVYQKRPIYWLFDSGKQNGLKALVYMHRYDENTIGNLRIDYLHRMQRIYENEIGRMQDTIENSKDAREVSAATKRKEKLIKQLQETKEYDEKIAHLALTRTSIDLDDGVKVNYEKVQTDRDGKKLDVLAKI